MSLDNRFTDATIYSYVLRNARCCRSLSVKKALEAVKGGKLALAAEHIGNASQFRRIERESIYGFSLYRAASRLGVEDYVLDCRVLDQLLHEEHMYRRRLARFIVRRARFYEK